MKSLFTIISFLGFLAVIHSQEIPDECFTIDFENLEDQGFRERDQVSDQYLEEFGVRFEIESGGFPILAKAGSPTVAFGGNYGNDQCAPTEDVGEYFLTDDGVLDGLASETIVIYFEVPVNRVEGCILDMDFDEEFYLEARDVNNNLIASLNVSAGDPGTGDGLATCWTLLPLDCNTTIYSITMEGERNIPGAFGLGLDNLKFCYQGFDIRDDNVLTSIPHICGESNGRIEIENSSNEEYTYSFNGGPFTNQTLYENIESGFHQISVVNNDGCKIDLFVYLEELPEYIIEYLSIDTKCGLDNGSILFTPLSPTTNTDFEISINDDSIDVSSILNSSTGAYNLMNVTAGTYQIEIIDENGCKYEESLIVDVSEEPKLDSIQIVEEIICNQNSGSFNVFASGGLGAYQYSLDNINYTENSELEVEEAGMYTIYLKDDDDCQLMKEVMISSSPEIEVDIQLSNTGCLTEDGSIQVLTQGGVGQMSLEWGHTNAMNEAKLTNLASGEYRLTITDEVGCVETREAVIETGNCPIYVPNVINSSVEGDVFKLGFKDDYDAQIESYRIYNRWGNLVFQNENFDWQCEDCWWDGKIAGVQIYGGVYAYHIRVIHPDKSIELLTGSVTLIR